MDKKIIACNRKSGAMFFIQNIIQLANLIYISSILFFTSFFVSLNSFWIARYARCMRI